MWELFLNNIVVPASASVLAWFLARKKYQAEVATNEIQNVEQAISIWKQIAMDLQEQLKTATEKISALQMQITQLEIQINSMKR